MQLLTLAIAAYFGINIIITIVTFIVIAFVRVHTMGGVSEAFAWRHLRDPIQWVLLVCVGTVGLLVGCPVLVGFICVYLYAARYTVWEAIKYFTRCECSV